MRSFIQIVESASSYYEPSAVWLHGGPTELKGGAFMRNGRNGRDMGGLFFVKESPDGWRYAAGYTIRYRQGAVYRCHIELASEQVFDFANETRRTRLAEIMPEEDFAALSELAGDGHMPWPATPSWQQRFERYMSELGYHGAIIRERAAGVGGFTGGILSLCVFDPSVITPFETIPKTEALRIASGK